MKPGTRNTQEHGQDARKAGTALKLSSIFFCIDLRCLFYFIFFFIFVILRVFRLYRYGGMFRSSDYCVWACSVIPVWSGIPRFSAFRWF